MRVLDIIMGNYSEIIPIELCPKGISPPGYFTCNVKYSLIAGHFSTAISKLSDTRSNNIMGKSRIVRKDTSSPKPKVIMIGLPSRRKFML